MGTQKLKQKDIPKLREKLIAAQKNICPLCKTELLKADAVLDHDHTTGHIRFALHRSCNRAEGLIKRAARFSRSKDAQFFVKQVAHLWDESFTHNPLHPSFKTNDDKRLKLLKKRLKEVTQAHSRKKIEQEILHIKQRQL